MEKEFVNYEQALVLKELGFNEECLYYYNIDRKLFQVYNKYKINDTFKNSDEDLNIMLSAPLYQQAFRWFREKYELEYNITKQIEEDEFGLVIQYMGVEDWISQTYHPNYEEAEIECLKKLIELVAKL